MTFHGDHRVWQDVYRVPSEVGTPYSQPHQNKTGRYVREKHEDDAEEVMAQILTGTCN